MAKQAQSTEGMQTRVFLQGVRFSHAIEYRVSGLSWPIDADWITLLSIDVHSVEGEVGFLALGLR